MALRIAIVIILALAFTVSLWADQPSVSVPILYPRENSVVGHVVNVVLDPAADWSAIPFFQVISGKTEYPMVDTSTTRHAVQGVDLEPGVNAITVKLLSFEDEKKKRLKEIGSREIKVFSMVELYTGKIPPAGFKPEPFHLREREADCSGCHALESAAQFTSSTKPEEVICYACHRKTPAGKHIHGPASVWNCLACHNPDLYPVKYQFTSADPWKVSKTTQTVVPAVFTYSTRELFKPESAALASKDKARETFKEFLEYVMQNPGDRIRLEVHTDNTPIKKVKGKKQAYKNNQTLTEARAKTLTSLFKALKIPGKKLTAVGMGEKLPKVPNKNKDEKQRNNRVEIVVYPSDVKIKNSLNLPVLKDRERVIVNLAYSQGPPIKKLRVVERLSKGIQYVKGSSLFRGMTRDPKIKADELVWELGDMNSDFSEGLFYVVKKARDAKAVPAEIRVTHAADKGDISRDFGPKAPARRGQTVVEACMKCHVGVIEGKFMHGPADAGYCNLCHDPHASPYPAWLRKSSWDLCTTCHSEKATGRHVVAGFALDNTHPTKQKRDPARPGKRMSCASCHNPHGGESPDLYAYNVKSRNELCNVCHLKKLR